MGKPLFIPLCAEPYEEFERGEKPSELRAYGPRWNEKTCPPGRKVILSKGYGKQNRLNGEIIYFEKVPARQLDAARQKAVQKHYGTTDLDVAIIGIRLGGNETVNGKPSLKGQDRQTGNG